MRDADELRRKVEERFGVSLSVEELPSGASSDPMITDEDLPTVVDMSELEGLGLSPDEIKKLLLQDGDY